MDFDLDYMAAIGSIIFSLIFIIPMWKMDTWTQSGAFSWQIRLIMTIILPVILYFVVLWQINK